MLDSLRSCYSTKAVLTPGGLPQDIHWWWAAPDAPRAPRHHWGSLLWTRPQIGSGPEGEVPDAPGPWRNGSRPPGACGQAVDCDPATLPATLYARVVLGAQDMTFPIDYDPAQERWAGLAPQQLGLCGEVSVTMACQSSTPSPKQWRVTISANIASGTVSDSGVFDAQDPPTPFSFTLPLVEVAGTCAAVAGDGGSVTVSDSPPALDSGAWVPLPLS